MSEHSGLTAFDEELLRSMGIAAMDSPFPADTELVPVSSEPVVTVGRLARLKHVDGTETRKFHLTQDEAVEWLQKTRGPDDDIVIENAERPKDIDCEPYPSRLTVYDRRFLAAIGLAIR
jgi:hypothetical protein